jgi:protein phosphatase
VALLIVLGLLVRTVRRARRQDEPAAALNPNEETPLQQDDADLTKLRVFSKDLLPKLSFDEPDEEDEPVEDSTPNLYYEGDAWLGVDEPTGPHSLIVTAAAGQTDRGKKRTRNEDACLVDPALDLYIVADGMGGYAGGDVAANTAVAEVRAAVHSGIAKTKQGTESWPRRGRELVAAITKANEVVHSVGGKTKELSGMGTTILAARFSRGKQRVYVAHVGDSRLYRFRGGTLRLLTTDHTLGAKGVTGPLATNVRRAVGVSPDVKVDVLVDKPLPDDLYLLCSDGMYKMLSDAETSGILAKKTGTPTAEDLKAMVTEIINAANAAGGRDNISVLLVGIRDASVAEQAEPRQVHASAE